MLSTEIREYLENDGVVSVSGEERNKYLKILEQLKIDPVSAFGEFCLAFPSPDLSSSVRAFAIENVCWNIIYTSSYEYMLQNMKRFGIDETYIPFTSLEGEGGFFYNRETGEVLDLSFAQIADLKNGILKPQWKNFNDFLTWYFGL